MVFNISIGFTNIENEKEDINSKNKKFVIFQKIIIIYL